MVRCEDAWNAVLEAVPAVAAADLDASKVLFSAEGDVIPVCRCKAGTVGSPVYDETAHLWRGLCKPKVRCEVDYAELRARKVPMTPALRADVAAVKEKLVQAAIIGGNAGRNHRESGESGEGGEITQQVGESVLEAVSSRAEADAWASVLGVASAQVREVRASDVEVEECGCVEGFQGELMLNPITNEYVGVCSRMTTTTTTTTRKPVEEVWPLGPGELILLEGGMIMRYISVRLICY